MSAATILPARLRCCVKGCRGQARRDWHNSRCEEHTPKPHAPITATVVRVEARSIIDDVIARQRRLVAKERAA